MSYRDKSQGFGFVYLDISKLLAQKNLGEDPVMDPEALTVNLNKDPFKAKPAPVTEVTQNLDRLATLHQKLHVLMEELNQLTKKKKS